MFFMYHPAVTDVLLCYLTLFVDHPAHSVCLWATLAPTSPMHVRFGGFELPSTLCAI